MGKLKNGQERDLMASAKPLDPARPEASSLTGTSKCTFGLKQF